MNTHRHRPLPLDCLRSFEAVARHLNFSAAADELHLTQPAMSRQIQRLEDELGTALFNRGTRRVALTAAGHSLIRVVEPTLARLDATVRQIRLAQGRAQVSVSTFASFATLWLMPRLPGFERGREGVDIRLSATDRLMELDSPELDLLLRHCKPERAPPGAWRLFGEVLTPGGRRQPGGCHRPRRDRAADGTGRSDRPHPAGAGRWRGQCGGVLLAGLAGAARPGRPRRRVAGSA